MRCSSFPKVPGSIRLTTLLTCSGYLHVLVALWRYCPVKGGVTANQLDEPSLTLLLVAGCGRLLQLAALWATSVALLQVVYN